MVSTTFVSIVLSVQHFYFLVAVALFAEAESGALPDDLVSIRAVWRGLFHLQVADTFVQGVDSVCYVHGLSRAGDCHLLFFHQVFHFSL